MVESSCLGLGGVGARRPGPAGQKSKLQQVQGGRRKSTWDGNNRRRDSGRRRSRKSGDARRRADQATAVKGRAGDGRSLLLGGFPPRTGSNYRPPSNYGSEALREGLAYRIWSCE